MKRIRVLLSLLGIALPLFGQDPPAPEPPALKTGFSVFPLEHADWGGILYAPQGDPERGVAPVAFNRLERSVRYEYEGPPPLRFYRREIDAEGNPRFVGVASVTPGEGVLPHDLILFFTPERPRGPYRIQFMADSPEAFPDESIVFFNTMEIPMVGVLGDHRLHLPPGASAPFMVDGFFDRDVPIVLAIHHDDDLHLVARNRIRFSPQRRTLLLLRPPSREGSMRIRTQRLTEYTGERTEDEPPPPPKDGTTTEE